MIEADLPAVAFFLLYDIDNIDGVNARMVKPYTCVVSVVVNIRDRLKSNMCENVIGWWLCVLFFSLYLFDYQFNFLVILCDKMTAGGQRMAWN